MGREYRRVCLRFMGNKTGCMMSTPGFARVSGELISRSRVKVTIEKGHYFTTVSGLAFKFCCLDLFQKQLII